MIVTRNKLAALLVLAALATDPARAEDEVKDRVSDKIGKTEGGAKRKILQNCGSDAECKEYAKKKKAALAKEAAKRGAGDENDGPSSIERAGESAERASLPSPDAPASAPSVPAGAPADDGAPATGDVPAPEASERAGTAASERSEKAIKRAKSAARTLKSSMQSSDGGPGLAGSAADPLPAPRTAAGAPDPANPRDARDLLAAERSGYHGAFEAAGLKVGHGPRGEPAILDGAGSPATAEALERLGDAIRNEPEALIKRPDFFEKLPRAKFQDLKNDYRSKPALRSTAFRDIALTESGRDFRWSSSCARLSGSCNPHAGNGSYRMGWDVPPEDLGRVWRASDPSREEEAEEEEDVSAEMLTTGRRLPFGLDAIRRQMAALGAMFGGGSDAGSAGGEGRSADSAEGAVSAGGWGADGARTAGSTAVGAAGGPRPAKGAGGGAASGGRGAPEPPGKRANLDWIYALAALVAAALALRGFRRA